MAPWPTGWLLTTLLGLTTTLGWVDQPARAQSAFGHFEARTVTRQAPGANNLPGHRGSLSPSTGHLNTPGDGTAIRPA
ncbi:MAG: hypothetical protein ACK5EA_30085, partial [Planctomycetaceae bacterium]